jgi:integrase
MTPQELERWLRMHCKTPATSNRYKAFISLCFREGIHNGKVKSNPARQVRSKRESVGRLRYLTRKEYDRLCEVIRECFPTHLAEFVVSVNTGMRLSEQYSLTWGQVNLERRTIDLTKPRMGPLEPCTSMPMRSPHLNPCALINRNRTTRFFQDKGPPLIRVHGFTHALKTPRSRSTSGIQTATRSVPGYRWLAHPSRKFKNSQATSRSSCQRDTATCLPNTGSQWSSA